MGQQQKKVEESGDEFIDVSKWMGHEWGRIEEEPAAAAAFIQQTAAAEGRKIGGRKRRIDLAHIYCR